MRVLSITAVRNEGPFLLEWIAWQQCIGITDFLIFSNDCDDGTDLLLDALAAAGIVQHQRHQMPDGKSVQWQALNLAWKHPLRKAADWMLFSDVDEFPVSQVGDGTLTALIGALPAEADALVLPWRLFGSAGLREFQDQPVTTQFTRAAPYPLCHPVAGSQFKTLFRPAAFRSAGVHRPKRRKEGPLPRWFNSDLTPLPDSFAAADGRLSLLGMMPARPLVELHHYSLRSVESFIVKHRRGLANRAVKRIDLGYWVERNFNTVSHEAMLEQAARLQAAIAVLKALPDVAQRHEAACTAHREAFRQAITDLDVYTLYAHCLHAGDSQPLPRELAQRMLRLFQQTT